MRTDAKGDYMGSYRSSRYL